MEFINCKLAFNLNRNHQFRNWDAKVNLRWKGIKIPPLTSKKVEERILATWSPLNPGRLKLNFDGASKGNPGPSGIGCVVRDNLGSFIGKHVVPILHYTNNIVKFKALIIGLTEC